MAVFVAQTVSIKRRLGKPSQQHCELKKTSEEHEEEHPNTSGAPRFSFNPIPHGWLRVRQWQQRSTQTSSYVPPFLSGYETRQTAPAGSSAVPFDVFSKTQRHPRQKPKAAQSAGIRHAFLLIKAPSSSLNSAGASCGSVSMTRLVWGSKVAMLEHMMPRP